MSFFKKFKQFFKKVAPFVAAVIAIVQPQFLITIGKSLGATTAATQAAVGSAVVSGSTAALSGANVEQTLLAAAGGGVGNYVGNIAGETAKLAGAGSIGSAAAAGGAGTGTSALIQTGDIEQALQAGAKAAVISGGTQAGVEGVKGAIESQPQSRLKAPAESLYQSGIGGESAPQPSAGFTGKVLTGGGVGFVAPANALYASRFAPSPAMRATEGGGVQPAYQTGQSLITPESLAGYQSPFVQQRQYTTPTLTQSEESALREALQLGIGGLFDQRKQAPDMGGGTMQRTAVVGPTQTQAAPGSQALAQALRIGDVGAPIFGKEGEEGKRAGWNVASLRYMGNSEA